MSISAAASVAVVVALTAGACTVPGTEKPKPAAEAKVARPGGTLTVATSPPGSLDPAALSAPTPTALSSLLCETLVTIDPATGEPRPALAESWVVADGGRGLLIKLKRKQAFSDGSRFDSRAVVNSLRRLINPQTASHMAELLKPVNGYDAYRKSVEDGAEQPTALAGLRIIEPYSFELILAGAHPDFVRTLAHPATAPISAGAAERDPVGFGRAPACVGPYTPAAPYTPGNAELRLRRAKDYHAQAPGFSAGGRGWADEIVMRVFPDPEAAYQAWVRGDVDVAALPPSRVAEARRTYRDDVASGPGSQIEYLALPFAPDSPFNDTDVRRTLAAAIDRQRIVDEVYGGSRIPATGFLPPIVGGAYRPAACSFAPPERKATLPPGPVKLYFNDEFDHRKLVQSIAAQWREKLGLAVEPVGMNWDQYLQRATTGTGFDSPFRVSWTPKAPTAVNYIEPLFHTNNIGNSNLERFSDPDVDQILDRELPRAADGDREVLLRQVEDRLCEKVALVPLVISEAHVVVRAERVASGRDDGRIMTRDGVVMLRELAVRQGTG
jgi:peptide/nickel transport system substrate-binding protein/oligopeptide transport system substrate-binding protein